MNGFEWENWQPNLLMYPVEFSANSQRSLPGVNNLKQSIFHRILFVLFVCLCKQSIATDLWKHDANEIYLIHTEFRVFLSGRSFAHEKWIEYTAAPQIGIGSKMPYLVDASFKATGKMAFRTCFQIFAPHCIWIWNMDNGYSYMFN